MNEPMSERHYVFSSYKHYRNYPLTNNENDPNTSTRRTENDLYTILWESDFDFKVFEPRKENWTDVATRLLNDDASGDVDHYVIETERSSVHEDERCSQKMSENDVTENEIQPTPANNRDAASPPNKSTSRTEKENNVTNELDDAEIVPNGGADITVPGISENEEIDENTSPRGENTIFNLTHPQLSSRIQSLARKLNC